MVLISGNHMMMKNSKILVRCLFLLLKLQGALILTEERRDLFVKEKFSKFPWF